MNTEKKYCPTCRVWIEDPGTREIYKYAKFWSDNRCDRCGSVLQFPQTSLNQINTVEESTDRVGVTTKVNAKGRTSLFSRLMDGLRRMFARNAWYKGTDGCQTFSGDSPNRENQNARSITTFIADMSQNHSASCQIAVAQFRDVYEKMSTSLRAKGYQGEQITSLFWSSFSSVCPSCNCSIDGENLGQLAVIAAIGLEKVSLRGPGRAIRFLREGLCLNPSCNSREIVLRWEAHPTE